MGGHELGIVDHGLPFVVTVLLLAVVLKGLLAKLWRFSFKPPPISSLLFAFGAALELGTAESTTSRSVGRLGQSVDAWSNVDPHVILFVLLPPLIFESAFSLNVHVFKKVGVSSIVLAGPGVVLSVALTAAVLMSGAVDLIAKDATSSENRSAWDWHLALVLASVLSATDPVAVVAVLSELHAPAALRHLIEGESLVNDGTAFSLFLLFHNAVTERNAESPEDAPVGALGFVLRLALGGPVFGLLCAWLTQRWAQWMNLHLLSALTVPAVFATFLCAEQGVVVSGVLAVVAFGLFLTVNNSATREQHHHVWSTLAEFADALIFALSGVMVAKSLARAMAQAIVGTLCSNVLLLYVLLHAIRATVVAACTPFLSSHAYGFCWKDAALLTFAGLRGAVSLALGLIVVNGDLRGAATRNKHGLDARDELMFYISGMVLLTTFVNGLGCEWLYKKLAIAPANPFRTQVATHALAALAGQATGFISKVRADARDSMTLPSLANWEAVECFVGVRMFDTTNPMHAAVGEEQEQQQQQLAEQDDGGGLFGLAFILRGDSAAQQRSLECMEGRLEQLRTRLQIDRLRMRLSAAPSSGDLHDRTANVLEELHENCDGASTTQLKTYDRWDDKAKATLTTVLQSMHHAFLAMHDRHEISTAEQALLLEVVEIGKDMLVGGSQGDQKKRVKIVFSKQQSVGLVLDEMERCLSKMLRPRAWWRCNDGGNDDGDNDGAQRSGANDFALLQRRIHAWSAFSRGFKQVQTLLSAHHNPCPIVRNMREEIEHAVGRARQRLGQIYREAPGATETIHTLQALRSVTHVWLAKELRALAASGFLDGDTYAAMELLVSRLLAKVNAFGYDPYAERWSVVKAVRAAIHWSKLASTATQSSSTSGNSATSAQIGDTIVSVSATASATKSI